MYKIRVHSLRKRLLLLFVVFAVSSCAKSGPQPRSAEESFLPNMAKFSAPMEVVWEHVLNTLRYDFLYPLALVNRQNGFFVTDMIRDDYQDLQDRKFRVSGTLKYDGTGVVVVLYKEEEVRTQDGWEKLATDFILERDILNKIKERFSQSN